MRWPWKKQPQTTENPRPRVEDAKRTLEAVRAQRPDAERKAALLRWHLEENGFRDKALRLITGEDR